MVKLETTFIGPANPMGIPILNKGNKGTFGNAIEIGTQLYDQIPQVYKNKAGGLVMKEFGKAATKVRTASAKFGTSNGNNVPPKPPTGSGSGSRGGGGGSGPTRSGSSGNPSGYGLSSAPKPQPISLNSGVRPNTYSSDIMDAIWQTCAPLHMSGVKFQFPTYAASTLYNYFLNVIAFDIQSKAQVNVGFNLNVGTDFSAANILSAFNALAYAVQVYLYYASITSYFSNPHNKNGGMIFLRQGITPQLLEDLSLLERRLLDTPIPPNLLKLLRYLSGTFASGLTEGSPLIKLYPITPSATMIDTTQPAAALAALSTNTNNLVFSLMRRSVPQWKPSAIYDVPTDPQYDQNFSTIFANVPAYVYISSASVGIPAVANSTATVAYNSYANDLDGVAYALTSLYDTVLTQYLPGLMVPSNTAGGSAANNTRQSYYANSSNTTLQFYPSDADVFLSRSRPETYKFQDSGSTVLGLHLPGAKLCQSVTESTVKESAYKAVDWIMSLDSIKIDVRKYHFGSQNSRQGGRS